MEFNHEACLDTKGYSMYSVQPLRYIVLDKSVNLSGTLRTSYMLLTVPTVASEGDAAFSFCSCSNPYNLSTRRLRPWWRIQYFDLCIIPLQAPSTTRNFVPSPYLSAPAPVHRLSVWSSFTWAHWHVCMHSLPPSPGSPTAYPPESHLMPWAHSPVYPPDSLPLPRLCILPALPLSLPHRLQTSIHDMH